MSDYVVYQDVTNNPVLRIYKYFKNEFKYEDHQEDCVKIPYHQKALTTCRNSSHTLDITLEIEKGGTQIRPLQSRRKKLQLQCMPCFKGRVSFLSCHISADECYDFLRQMQNKYPNVASFDHIEKFLFLMENKDASYNMDGKAIIGSIFSLMICDRQGKTGAQLGRIRIGISQLNTFPSHTYPTELISIVCISTCVGMRAYVWTGMYLPVHIYTWVCMISHMFKCMLQHVVIIPPKSIHIVLFAFIYIFAILCSNTFICPVYFITYYQSEMTSIKAFIFQKLYKNLKNTDVQPLTRTILAMIPLHAQIPWGILVLFVPFELIGEDIF